MLFFKSSKRQLNIYIFIAIQDQAIMHIFEMIWYPPLASLTKILQANVIQKKEARHSHVQNGWWHILCSHFFFVKTLLWWCYTILTQKFLSLTSPSLLQHHKNLPISHNAPHFSKSKKASWQIPRLYFTSLCANSKCEMAVNENYLAVII